MSKYITHFQTEAAYQSALPSLDLPNVSLVDELGEVHYHRALYGAHAGDIALYDVANAQKIVVTKDDWNLTSYPTVSYPIVGVVVADESAAGCKVCAVTNINTDGTPTTNNKYYGWQNTNFDWGLTKYSTSTDAKTDFNGKANTTTIINAIKAYDLAHSTDSITGCASQCIQLYAPTGTVAGEWYIPACGEMKMAYDNFTVINTTLNKIHTADSSLANEWSKFTSYITSSEKDDSDVWRTSYDRVLTVDYKQKNYNDIGILIAFYNL